MRLMILFAFVTLVSTAGFGLAQLSGCERYEPTVVIMHGTIVRRTFPGPPNYDNIHKGDRAETYWLLKLDTPVCVDEKQASPDLNPAAKGIRAVQLVMMDVDAYKKYRELVGKRVIAKGSLFGQITAHHHTPVLMKVKSIEPTK